MSLDALHFDARDYYAAPAYRIQYIPQEETPQEDADDKPAAPTALQVIPGRGFNSVRATVDFQKPTDFLQVYASIDNNRTNALKVTEAR